MPVAFFAGSFSILITWLFLIIIFIGLGLLIQRIFGLEIIDIDQYLMAFWMGFSFTILFLQANQSLNKRKKECL